MNSISLEYCIDGFSVISENVNSSEELKKQLQDIKGLASGVIKSPFSVDIVIENIGRLSIGLDDHFTILCYSSIDNEILISLGDETAEGETIFYFGDYSLMSNKYLIPYQEALDVVSIWIQTGKLSTSLNWTDKIF